MSDWNMQKLNEVAYHGEPGKDKIGAGDHVGLCTALWKSLDAMARCPTSLLTTANARAEGPRRRWHIYTYAHPLCSILIHCVARRRFSMVELPQEKRDGFEQDAYR
jgi:hypothetical protein